MKFAQIFFLKKKNKIKKRVFSFISRLFPKWAARIRVQFLRKVKTFIKSKYSKNRQWSKSIVYFGLWFGVVSVYIVTFYTYRFTFILSYVWWVPSLCVLLVLLNFFKKFYKHINLNFMVFFI